MLLSRREFGRKVGKSHTAVRKWIGAGMPTVGGRIDLESAQVWLAANREALEGQRVAEVRSELMPAEAKSGTTLLTLARTEREQVRAEREALLLGQAKSELVSRTEIRELLGDMIIRVRARLLMVPSKVARFGVPVQRAVQSEIETALQELSNQEV